MGRSYAFQYRQHLYQAPVGYYANRKAWDLAPGYERDPAPDLSRPITPDCLYCHATSVRTEPGTLNMYREIVHGIQCARCHGESTDHAKLVNPRKLHSRRRDSICEQCHLSGEVRLVQPGKKMEDFVPGADLSDTIEVFTASSRGVAVNGHADAFAVSHCKQASGEKLWCGTCHNPHRPPQNYAAVCRTCHTAPHDSSDCVPCHMPKAKAYDGGHAVFTDHSISTHAPRQLSSYFGRQPSPRNLGLAYVRLASSRKEPEYLEKAWPLLRGAAASRQHDPLLYYEIANLLAASGRKQDAVEYYRIALEQDPLQPDALLKLAALLGRSAEARELREKASTMVPRPN
jgi:tetratricopeptide (TPR) repeat protein